MQGIVVAGEGADGRGYVLEDASMLGSPEQWAARVAFLFHKYQADRVVAEKNYGGAMVEAVLRAAAPNLPLSLVTASRGKSVRAEPIAALYEQNRITHAEPFVELEDELVMMTGSGYAGSGSPNRLDAMVWAFILDAKPAIKSPALPGARDVTLSNVFVRHRHIFRYTCHIVTFVSMVNFGISEHLRSPPWEPITGLSPPFAVQGWRRLF